MTSLELAKAAADAAADKNARDVVVLDVREQLVITDYFVICSGGSDRQVKTICEEVGVRMKALGRRPLRTEGLGGSTWVLLDFGDFVVHVFTDETRVYYDLERLWKDAPRVAEAADSRAVP